MPTVSVIVPNYNHGRFLRQRIDTILAQTFQDFELILLDDCSTDGSREILQEYATDPPTRTDALRRAGPRSRIEPLRRAGESQSILREYTSDASPPRRVNVRLEFNEANSGSPFKQWNKGVRLAQGKYIWIAESDDYAEPHLLERLVAMLDADPTVSFAYCRSWCVNEDGGADGYADDRLRYLGPYEWSADFCKGGRELCEKLFCCANAVPNASGVVFRKAAYELVGGPDEGLRLCGDWKLWAAMALQGKVGYVSEPLNHFRFHEGSIRTESFCSGVDPAESLHVIRWLMGQVTPPDSVREKVCEMSSLYWVGAVMSMHVPLRRKRSILRDVAAIDPRPLRRAVRPALRVVGLKIQRHWRGLLAREKYAGG